MTNNLPNLPAWHRVPIGATIPAGTPYAYAYMGGVTVRDVSNYTYYTEHPIAPPLPTEEGATILVSDNECPPHILLAREGDHWINCYGLEWSVGQFRAWCPVTLGETVVMPRIGES